MSKLASERESDTQTGEMFTEGAITGFVNFGLCLVPIPRKLNNS